MDAGNPNQPRHQLSGSDYDEIPLFAPGPNGEIQISTEDGGILQPVGGPYGITSPVNQPMTVNPGPPLTISIPITTQVSPSMATDSPIMFSMPPLSQSEVPIGSTPSTTEPLYSQTGSSPTSTAQPVSESSTVTGTSSPSVSHEATFTSDSTILRQSTTTSATLVSSRTVLVSTASTSTFTSSTISTSRSLSMTTISISSSSMQTIVISSSIVSSSSVFTSSVFSSASSRNSSAIATSTSPNQTPTQTVTAPPLPGTGSNLNVHSPPYYVGIVFGTIAGIGLLAVLIAWWIRLRSHARRRRLERTHVPWARSDDDDGGLEAGHGRHDLTKGWPWTPRGDRDVGEPKRSESYLNGSQWSLHNHTIPGHNLFSDESFGALSGIDGYTPAGVRHNLSRHGPGRLSTTKDDVMHSNNRGHQLYVVNDVPSSLQPSYLSRDESMTKLTSQTHLGGTHDMLAWNQKPPDPRPTMAERLRNLGKPPPEAPFEDLDALPTPGGTGVHADNQAWGSSIKSSLVNAFNAVAANLATPLTAAPQMSKNEGLDIPPAKAARKSINDNTIWGEKQSGLHRDDTLSSTSSKPWTLEETGNGAGIVHLRMPETKTLSKTSHRPSMPAPNLSFGDGDSISMYSEKESLFQQIPTRESQVPLFASSKPLPVHIRPDSYFARQVSSETIPAANQLVSSNNTVRSAPSAVARTRGGGASRGNSNPDSDFDFRGAPRMPPGIDNPGFSDGLRRGNSGKDSVVIQPSDTISRLSSSDTSLVASMIDTTRSEQFEMDAASRALKDRHRKASQGALC